jgi:hypothetical protein
MILGLITTALLFMTTWVLTRITRPSGMVEPLLTGILLLAVQIVVLGVVLSTFTVFNQIMIWAGAAVAWALIIGSAAWLIPAWRNSLRLEKPAIRIPLLFTEIWQADSRSKLILFPALATFVFLAALNLWLVVRLTPHEWDSMTYHLARVGYYLQHGTLAYYDATFWAQVVHPQNSAILLSFVMLVSDLNENLTQLVQYIAYGVCVIAVYGIGRQIGNTILESLFGALVFGLLIEGLLQATTTQNDMVIAATVGIATYHLFAARQAQWRTHLALAGLAIAFALGVKSAVLLAFPSLGLIAFYTIFRGQPFALASRRVAILGIATSLATLVVTLPVGYLENLRVFGNPLGPSGVRTAVSFEGMSLAAIAQEGTRNLVRYAYDFLSLDGMKGRMVYTFQQQARTFITSLIIGMGLDVAEGTRALFVLQKAPSAHEGFAYWGILGFGVVWLGVFILLLPRIGNADAKVLAVALLLFTLTQAFAGPYDPWRGRYFMTGAIFGTPAIGYLLRGRRYLLVMLYLTVLMGLGSYSAVQAIILRDNRPLISYTYETDTAAIPIESALVKDRLGQMSTQRGGYYEIIQAYESLVPQGATVAHLLPLEYYEYPFFGEHLNRRLIALNSFVKGHQPIPQEADYLLFAARQLPPEVGDVLLGTDKWSGEFYLRTLR